MYFVPLWINLGFKSLIDTSIFLIYLINEGRKF